MSTEQQQPAPALMGALEGRKILPQVLDPATTTTSADSIHASDRPRRLRACVACKASKLRCQRDESRPGDACERCLSAGRQCIVSAPVRNKRPRRNVSTVASLESKVDALLAALREKQAGNVEDGTLGTASDPVSDLHIQSMHEPWPRRTTFEDNVGSSSPSSNSTKSGHSKRKRILQAEDQYSFAFFMPRNPNQDRDRQEDVIDQGLISVEESAECFLRFTELMLPHFPVVAFSPGTTAPILRRTRPVLFLAILGAASSHLGEGVRKLLVEELMKTFANRIIMRGDKSLDLVQAVQVSAIWYFPPERFDEVKVYQLFHLAAIMAAELDLGSATRPSSSKLSLLGEGHPGRPPPGPFQSQESKPECQRAWLSCYIVCSIAFMVTRRPNLMRWTSYMDDCIQALENPAIGVSSDLYLCQWVRAQKIAEEVGQQFFMDDPFANVDVSDLSVQYVLRGYEIKIDQWKAQISPEILRPTLQIEAGILNLYLHEIYLHDGHNIKEFAASFLEESPLSAGGIKSKALDPVHRKAIAICIKSVRNIFDIFLSFDSDTLCSIPVLYYVRTAYTVFAMMKIHFAASRLDSDLQQMVEKDLNVEFYIEELLNTLQKVSRTRKLRVAAIFRLVLLMLRTWFQRQKSQTDPNLVHVRQNDTIFHTVLQTADDIGADRDVDERNAIAHGTEIANSFFHVQPRVDNAAFSSVDPWALEQDNGVLPWNDFDFESFMNVDNPTLLQITLERLGGLVG